MKNANWRGRQMGGATLYWQLASATSGALTMALSSTDAFNVAIKN